MSEVSETTKADRRYASRKFLLSLLLILIGSIVWILSAHFKALPAVTTEQWITLCKWILGLYTVGNLGDSTVNKLALSAQAKSARVAE